MRNYLMVLADAAANGDTGNTPNTSGGATFIIVYILFFVVIIYFLFIRPNKKQQARQQELMESIKPGDVVMTTSGFYGTVIGMEDDTVIVEFGNNKNCRIPMHKRAIAEVESANATYVEEETKEDKKEKKAEKAEAKAEEKVEEKAEDSKGQNSLAEEAEKKDTKAGKKK